MKVLRLLLILLIGGGLGLLAVPLLPQQAQDWVTTWQSKVPSWAEQVRETLRSTLEREGSTSPARTATGVTQTPFAASTPTPIPVAISTLTPTPTAAPTLSPTPTPRPTTQELKVFMLDLINRDRMSHGLAPVELGNNPAAQVHAEELIRHGFLGHWGLDGLKPYMRYTLAGGTGAESENVSGSSEPRVPGARYAKTPIRDSLREAQEGLMSSPGHRRNILDPSHQRVNLGIACDDVGCSVVQQFEHNYVQFDRVPSIKNGRLVFSGRTLGGFVYGNAQVWYDPLPKPLQAAQIRATYCYDSGTPIVFIRKPAPPGSFYTSHSSEYPWSNCLDPRDVDPAAPPPKVRAPLPEKVDLVPRLDAEGYRVQGAAFDVAVDVSRYMAQYGHGVYTIVIWGDRGEESVTLTNYSIFVESP